MTPTDLQTLFDNNSDCYADTGKDRLVVQAMTFKKFKEVAASLNRQGCRWVKASERLPDKRGECVVRVTGGENLENKIICMGWLHSDIDQIDATKGSVTLSYSGYSLSKVEWLDESIEPCATSSELNYDNSNVLKQAWAELRSCVCSFLTANSDKMNDPYVVYGDRAYTREQLYNEVMNGTKDGIHTIELLVKLTIDNISRGKQQLERPSPTGDRDCEELKKEVEYLKEVIKGMQDDFNKEIGKYQY